MDYSAPFQIVRALFLSDPDLKIKTAKWFLEEIMNNDDFPVSESEDCAICMDKLEEKDYIKLKASKDGKTYGCGHKFHKECITKWLNTAHMCPLCRHDLPVDSNADEMAKIERRYNELQEEQRQREARAEKFSHSMFG